MDIKEPPSGRVVRSLTGYRYFVPNPLPPPLEWDNALVGSLSRADHILGMLAMEGTKLPHPHLFVRPFIAREAVLSSRIEGTRTTLDEILAQGSGARVNRDPDDVQEVQNYIVALDYGIARLQELPLSLRLIKEIHGKLMYGVRGSHATLGEFRSSQNWIGSAGCTLNTATYVPPSPAELMDCLSLFEKFLHNRTLPPLVHVALCHYQFEAIHPFLDGNGRIGRLLITPLLIAHGLLPSPLLYLSAFFEATRDEYYRQLYNVSNKGTWREWLLYFLHGVAIQGRDVLSRAERISALITEWQRKVSSRRDAIAQEVIKNLAITPYCTAKKVAEQLGIAFTTAQRAIEKLEALGIVHVSKRKRDRVYCAQAILEILEEPTKTREHLDGTLW